MTDTGTPARRTSRAARNVWSDEERAAMQDSARERKKAARLSPEEERAEGERDVRAKIAEMPEHDRRIAERIYAIVTTSVPSLMPKTYYGMPAWAKDGRTICFFKPASKFKVRYATFEFQPDASLDDGDMWPVAFALPELTPTGEARIAALVKQAAR